jgi:hypothetical protein
MTSIGGDATSPGPGRLLNSLVPKMGAQEGAIVWTKDHQYSQTGNARPQAVAIKKM